MKPTKVRVTTITCSRCGNEIYSRAVHDFHSCKCGSVTVDGGFDYLHMGWQPEMEKPEVKHRYINVTRKELFEDWNTSKDRFGFIAKKGD